MSSRNWWSRLRSTKFRRARDTRAGWLCASPGSSDTAPINQRSKPIHFRPCKNWREWEADLRTSLLQLLDLVLGPLQNLSDALHHGPVCAAPLDRAESRLHQVAQRTGGHREGLRTHVLAPVVPASGALPDLGHGFRFAIQLGAARDSDLIHP